MTLDGFLGFLGIVVAVYALLPRYKILEIKLIWRPLDWILLFIFLSLIFGLQFYSFFKAIGLVPHFGISERYQIYPKDVSFVLMVACPLIWYVLIRSRVMGIKKINVFKQVIEELYFMEKYNEIFLLLDRMLPSLSRIYYSDFRITKLRKSFLKWNDDYPLLNNISTEELLKFAGSLESDDTNESPIKGSISDRIKCYKDRIFYSIGKRLPDYSEYQDGAREIIRRVFLDKKLVSEMSKSNPYLALKFLNSNLRENEEFLMLFLPELLKSRHSILFKEIKDNQNYDGPIRMKFPTSNRLLRCILQNSKNAEKWAVYRGVGEYFIEELNSLSLTGNDSYNGPMNGFDDKKYESSLYISLMFFDLMIREAFSNNIPWHMWLYYYNSFIRGLLKNLQPSAGVDHNSEFPTRYHFLIYSIFSQLTDWIDFLDEDIDLESENVKVVKVSYEHENNNIIKSSMICLGGCLGDVLLSDNLSFEFKKYIFEIVVRANLKLMKNETLKDFASTFTECIKHGGAYVRDERKYEEQLKYFFSLTDIMDVKIHFYDEFKILKNHFV